MIPIKQFVGSSEKQTIVSVSKTVLQIGSSAYELTDSTRVQLITALLKHLPANVKKEHFENVTPPKSGRRKSASIREWGAQYDRQSS